MQGEDVLWPAVWFFERVTDTGAIAAAEVDAAFGDLLLGEQLEAMSLGAGAYREGGAIIAGREAGHAVFGPYLRLAAGAYSVTVSFSGLASRPGASGKGRVVVEVALGDAILAQKTLHPRAPEEEFKPVRLEFTISDAAAPCEIRVWSDGASAMRLVSI